MRAVILNGSILQDRTGMRIRSTLTAQLQQGGWEVEHFPLEAIKIGNCAGDFYCWVRRPGVCNIDDDNRNIAQAIVGSDLLIYLTPITFGGYSSVLKKAVDHQIQNISPFFARVNGETHHQKRYRRYPNFMVLGWMDEPDAQEEAVFRHLVERNALNFFAKKTVTGVVSGDQDEAQIEAMVQGCLQELGSYAKSKNITLPEFNPISSVGSEPQRAVLLVGSPRTRKSTSHSLGTYLIERLEEHNIQIETIYLHTVLRSREKMQALQEAVDDADLVLLAFPLYVDSLPAPTIETLEKIFARRTGHVSQQRFAVIANSGFPEADHNLTALAICALFARRAGFEWAGSLALGAGEGMVHGTPLSELDGRALPLRRALELAADALAAGRSIPEEAQALLAKPFIPPWLYRLIGIVGWRQQAKRWGAAKLLRQQPYA